jgi:hypothetical protein
VRAGRALAFAVALAALAVGSVAHAHRLNAALTVVEISPITGRLVVSHRMYAHDLEHALRLGSAELDWFETEAGKRQLGAYTADRFTLKDANGAPVPLTFRASEIDGALVWAYFDAPAPADLSAITVNSQLLHDYAGDQINLVNVRFGDVTRSGYFDLGAEPRTLVFPPASSADTASGRQ